jgi:hypothetical protein
MKLGPATRRGTLLAAVLVAIGPTARTQPQTPPPAQTRAGTEANNTAAPGSTSLYGYCIAASQESATLFLSDVIRGLTDQTHRISERQWREYLGPRISAADAVQCRGGFPSKTLDYEKRDAAASEFMRSQGLSQRVYTGWSG